MPVAQCFCAPSVISQLSSEQLITDWANASGIESHLLTIDLLQRIEQSGHPYQVIAHIYLPNVWSKTQGGEILNALAHSLRLQLSIDSSSILLMTHWLHSGDVLEGDKRLQWRANIDHLPQD